VAELSRETPLPPADTELAFSRISEDLLRPGVDSLCRSLGIDSTGLQRYPTGSVPVYSVRELVLKLFPPVHVSEYLVEAGVLAAVEGRLPIPTPRVHESGESHGWGYVAMDRLVGTGLHDLWPMANREEKLRLAAQLGEILAALHEVPVPTIDPWWPADWSAFVDEQRETAVERHRARELGETWLEQIPDFLADVHLGRPPPVLLHTEVMPTNLLAIRDAGGNLSLSGLLDFEAAMRGAAQYEFVALGLFVAEGDVRMLRQALTAYGYRDDQLDHHFSRQTLAWTLLHYYGNLASYLRRLPQPTEPTLDALASCWFGES
jgi:hygromycin-B 7''-O-kinase